MSIKGGSMTFKQLVPRRRQPAAQIARQNRRKIDKIIKDKDKKYIDTVINMTVAIAGGAAQIDLLNGVDRGDTVLNREGDRVKFQRLNYRLTMKATGAETGWACRLIMVYDRQANGAAPGMVQILTANSVHGLMATDRLGRYHILFDRTYTFPSVERTRSIKGSFSLRNLQGNYCLANAGDVTDIQKGSIHLFANTIDNATAVDVDGEVRVIFHDD